MRRSAMVRQRGESGSAVGERIESARLLLMSKSARFPDGLANSNGVVGRNAMFGNTVNVSALFERPLNEYKGVVSGAAIVDFVHSDPKRGFYGGGRMTSRGILTPLELGLEGLSPEAPRWERRDGSKKALREEANHLDDDHFFRDATGAGDEPHRSGPRCEGCVGIARYADHFLGSRRRQKEHGVFPAEVHRDLKCRGSDLKVWAPPVSESRGGAYCDNRGTCRMGNDPKTSVVDKYHTGSVTTCRI